LKPAIEGVGCLLPLLEWSLWRACTLVRRMAGHLLLRLLQLLLSLLLSLLP